MVVPILYSFVLVGAFCYYFILQLSFLSAVMFIDTFLMIFEIYYDGECDDDVEGFYEVMYFFWTIIIKPFLLFDEIIGIQVDSPAYVFFGIYIDYDEDMLHKVDYLTSYVFLNKF
ncbi:13255_t:CDS:1 [Funneliformis caledonium]|uniref:13255_t:CDS:1 n=1 Tax=Funneliformis caledonium TaxID=1117310 RepID=A0A9N9BX02_9GLOM|nr:13255_t:CDS:1 [Funneliformis caledonium]